MRISGVDGHGLEGLPQVYAFERRQFGLAASSARRAGSKDYEFRWLVTRPGVETRFRFVLAHTPDLRDPVVDQTDIARGQLVIHDLPRGVYYWTVIAEQFENGRSSTRRAVRSQSFTLAY